MSLKIQPYRSTRRFYLLPVLLIVLSTQLQALQSENFFLEAERAVIGFLGNTAEQRVSFFEEWIAKDSELTPEILNEIHEQLRPYTQILGIDGMGSKLIFMLGDGNSKKELRVTVSEQEITDISISDPEPVLIIRAPDELVDSLEKAGYAGLLYIKRNGKELIKRPFGYANEKLGKKNSVNTVFGVGSRPIDFTVASILLLDQQNKLSLDDPISEFFEEIPQDKQSLTVWHLMTGRSGFPDFFGTEEDWDPDLAYIDRETAEERLLNIELLFEPGSSQQHSHAAFGLLAAIAERVSGMEYYEFIHTHFLDPADMSRTGEYGETRGLNLTDFAVGGGPQSVGLPNIPPNWGPTSWLIKGSGGMYSTLGDLRKFYAFVRTSEVFDDEHRAHFLNESANLDGSMRGFELFTLSAPRQNTEVYLFLNRLDDRPGLRKVFRALEHFSFIDL